MHKYIITNGAQIWHEINGSKNNTLLRLYKSYYRKIIQRYTFRTQNKRTIRKKSNSQYMRIYGRNYMPSEKFLLLFHLFYSRIFSILWKSIYFNLSQRVEKLRIFKYNKWLISAGFGKYRGRCNPDMIRVTAGLPQGRPNFL
jgi:hypothetical protein